METRVKPTWLNIPAEIHHHLLNAKQPITRNSYRHIRNGERIDTAILRTCKLMYREALPILNDNVFLIEVRKLLVPWAAPQIVAAVPLMSNGSRLRIDPLLSNFIVDIKIEENFQVRYPSWADPIEAVADALTMVERVKTLQIFFLSLIKLDEKIPSPYITLININSRLRRLPLRTPSNSLTTYVLFRLSLTTFSLVSYSVFGWFHGRV